MDGRTDGTMNRCKPVYPTLFQSGDIKMQAKIRLLQQKEQSDQDLHCLQTVRISKSDDETSPLQWNVGIFTINAVLLQSDTYLKFHTANFINSIIK